MKKFLVIFVLFAGIFMLASCEESPEDSTYKIAMITDIGDIDDRSFNQGTYEGIEKYAQEHDVTYNYYKPVDATDSEYINSIDLAVAGGAEIVITPGYMFAGPIGTAQAKYPEVKFVILDGEPETVADNTLAVYFESQESAFYAGYSVVKEGYTELGFMGGNPYPSVYAFGIGYIAGAYYAAEEEGLDTFSFEADNYDYLLSFAADPAFKTKATSWYNAGVEVIHVAAGGAGSSVMSAAEELTDKWVIGVDSDQSNLSDSVITSALKDVGAAAYQACDDYFSGNWDGGKVIVLGSADGAVGLPLANSHFTNFTSDAYDAIFNKVVNGDVSVPTTVEELSTFVSGLGYTLSTDLADKIVPAA